MPAIYLDSSATAVEPIRALCGGSEAAGLGRLAAHRLIKNYHERGYVRFHRSFWKAFSDETSLGATRDRS